MQRFVGRLSLMRDAIGLLWWTDSPSGARLRAWLEACYAAQGHAPKGARRLAVLRLFGALGLATLFTPWLVLGLAWGSRVLAGDAAIAPWAGKTMLLLAWGLAGVYGRGILQLGRQNAWFQSVYRLIGQDLQGVPQGRAAAWVEPTAADGAVWRRWQAARRWAWLTQAVLLALVALLAHQPLGLPTEVPWIVGAALWLMVWMPQHYDGLVAAAFGMTLDLSDRASEPWTVDGCSRR